MSMTRLATIALSCWIAWTYGPWLGSWLFGWELWWLGFLVAFLVPHFVLNALVASFTGGIWNSGLWSSTAIRRLVGIFADGLIYIGIAIGLFCIFIYIRVDELIPRIARYQSEQFYQNYKFWLWLIPLALALEAFRAWPRPIKFLIGKVTRPFSNLLRSRFVGMGGSSRFGGLFDDWAHPYRPGQIMLGSSMYSPSWGVGRSDDRHFITIATSRSGKGRSAIIPNLLSWPGSALVIDPKGQNAAVTAAARGHGGGRVLTGMGQNVRIVDPFGELKNAGVDVPVHRFNPLAELDLSAPDIVERIHSITDALVVPDLRGEDFFEASSKTLISGAIAFVIAHPSMEPEKKNLTSVRGLLQTMNNEAFLAVARKTPTPGGLGQAAAALLDSLGKEARGDVLGTALTHTKWLDSLGMADVLKTSDFSLKELKATPTTVYLVLPPQYLELHGRFLRLFVNLALQAVGQGKKPRHPVLFVLDEFYALGRMQALVKASGLMAGYGMKLWPIVQNLGQIQELYPQNWEAFLGNAGMWQVFAVNDQTTARYMSERLGHHITWRKMRAPEGGMEWVPQGASFMRTSVELARESSRDSGNQIVFVEGGDSFLLRRRPYDKTFKLNQYSPDPFENEPTGLLAWLNRLRYDNDAVAERLEGFSQNTRLGRTIESFFQKR
jgi:type IV secretory pathway TraG/TraD family ATPase VirD4